MGKIQRALAIWSGFGMTLTGVQTCGDYMFSGHTVVITMLNFFVTECECSCLLAFKHRMCSSLRNKLYQTLDTLGTVIFSRNK